MHRPKRTRATLRSLVLAGAILAPLVAASPSASAGIRHDARHVGHALGTAARKVGREAKKAGLAIGHAAKAGGLAFWHAVKGRH
ncbi:hypothetical protein [Acidiferrobacter sp.]|uniref:hypothetical protein n=1 Tax=Acidiferrobacter sp. TaxID=1872107 RepID=UPI002636809C|nr:hypothetical protein [Acidiferrobacter sp.]